MDEQENCTENVMNLFILIYFTVLLHGSVLSVNKTVLSLSGKATTGKFRSVANLFPSSCRWFLQELHFNNKGAVH